MQKRIIEYYVGLELANGKYLCFCDSDDYYDKNYCAELYNDLIKNNSDFSMCDILQIDIKKNKKYLISKEINSFVVEKNKFMNLLFYERRLGNPINKLYKSKIIKSCKYPEGLIHEDTYIIYDILSKCNRISYLNKPLYNRVIHDNSITSSKKKNRLDEIKAFEHWMDGFNKNNDHINFVNATCMTLDSIIRSYILLFNILDLQEKKNLLLKFNDYYKKIDIKINLTKKLKYLLFKINPNLLKLIYCLINKK